MAEVETVLVTGATGFVAQTIIKTLVDRGYKVKGTVRKLKDTARYENLWEACGDKERVKIEFVEADLTSSDEVWDAAVKGCSACIHTAGPVKLTVDDVDKELLNPMLSGINNIFGACKRAGVKKVVYTSSATTLSDSFEKWATHTYGPDDWNTVSSKTRNPYPYAKTMAEKAAMEYVKANDKCFSLAVVNPQAIFGPCVSKLDHLSEPVEFSIRQALSGEMYLINYIFCLVDVRDLALVHVVGMEKLPADPAMQETIPRYVCWSGDAKFPEIVKVLAKAVPERKSKLPKVPFPNFAVLAYLKLFYPPGIFQYVKHNIKSAPKFDTSLVEKDLGIKFRPWQDTVRDTAIYIKEAGLLDKKAHKKAKPKA